MMKKVMWVQILIQAGVLCNTKAHQLQIRFFVEMLSGQWLLTNSFIHVLSLPFLTCLISRQLWLHGFLCWWHDWRFPIKWLNCCLVSLLLVIAAYDNVTIIASLKCVVQNLMAGLWSCSPCLFLVTTLELALLIKKFWEMIVWECVLYI